MQTIIYLANKLSAILKFIFLMPHHIIKAFQKIGLITEKNSKEATAMIYIFLLLLILILSSAGVKSPDILRIEKIIQEAKADEELTFKLDPPATYDWTLNRLDLDKLYYAVAWHESHNCGTAWHKKANNCVSIMSWPNGKRTLKKYASIEDNKADFKRLWATKYGGIPTLKQAERYSGKDNHIAWYKNVLSVYYSL